MGVEEVFFTISDVQKWVSEKVLEKNRMGELNEFLHQIGYYKEDKDEEIDEYNTKRPGKILVLGASCVSQNDLKGIAKSLGISSDQIDFELDFHIGKQINVQKYRYSSEYSDILVGPICHKNKGIEDNNCLITEIENNRDIYPNLTRITEFDGSLKISKTSFRNALLKTTLLRSTVKEAC